MNQPVWPRIFPWPDPRCRNKKPLIHCITHPIVINDCANAVLALGARPIMAEHPGRYPGSLPWPLLLLSAWEILQMPSAESIMLAGKERAAVLESGRHYLQSLPHGAGKNLIRDCHPAIIKGNASEIRAIAGSGFHDSGIDVSAADAVTRDNLPAQRQMSEILLQCARQNHAVVLATGEVDMTADWESSAVYLVENGSPLYGKNHRNRLYAYLYRRRLSGCYPTSDCCPSGSCFPGNRRRTGSCPDWRRNSCCFPGKNWAWHLSHPASG